MTPTAFKRGLRIVEGWRVRYAFRYLAVVERVVKEKAHLAVTK